MPKPPPGHLQTWTSPTGALFTIGYRKDGGVHILCLDDMHEWDFATEAEAKEFVATYEPKQHDNN